jgi:hypothetical protein
MILQSEQVRTDPVLALAHPYLNEAGAKGLAIMVLNNVMVRQVAHADCCAFLAALHTRQSDFDKARKVYEAAARNNGLSQQERDAVDNTARRLQ